jgi:hypothetical protein
MMQTLDILQAAHRDTIDSRMDLLELKGQEIPGSAHYVIRRYNAPEFVNMEDKGMLVYHYSKNQPDENFFECAFALPETGIVPVKIVFPAVRLKMPVVKATIRLMFSPFIFQPVFFTSLYIT